MTNAAGDAIEASFVDARFEQAARLIAATHSDAYGTDEVVRRLAAGIFAEQGRDRELASIADLPVLGCRTAADAVAWCSAIAGGAQSHDYLTAGVVLAGLGEREAAYDLLREAHNRALYERRFHVAVSARERLAHHAVLFGDTTYAQTALDESLVLAESYELIDWRTYCSSRRAALAIETDDLLAATHALDATETRIAVGAARAAALSAGPGRPLDPAHGRAMRRALIMIDTPSSFVEFLTLAAQHGDAGAAGVATAKLRASFAPHRRYVEAHYRLARASVAA